VSPAEILDTPITTPRFSFLPAPLAGIWRVQRSHIGDARGFFSRFYCAQEFSVIGMTTPLAQINHSLSRLRGTVRGLHFQHLPHAETKVVTCISGRIFDVAVDLRRGSPSFLHWFGTELSAQNQESLVIPPGFAHGYQSLSNDAEIIYLVTTAYSAKAEDGVNPFDPAVGIRWPDPIGEVSERDARRKMLDLADYAGLDVVAPEARDE
jgi:dTDP-4-dehydrorhamnose 3,5-epimerase